MRILREGRERAIALEGIEEHSTSSGENRSTHFVVFSFRGDSPQVSGSRAQGKLKEAYPSRLHAYAQLLTVPKAQASHS